MALQDQKIFSFGVLCAFLLAAVALASTGQKKPSSSPTAPSSQILKAARQPDKVPDGKVFTNEDLLKMFGNPEPVEPAVADEPPTQAAPSPPATEVPASPGESKVVYEIGPSENADASKVEDAGASKERKQIEAEYKRIEARQRIDELEKKALAIKNPYLPRPTPPKEAKEGWDQMDNVERLRAIEEELRKAREEAGEAEE